MEVSKEPQEAQEPQEAAPDAQQHELPQSAANEDSNPDCLVKFGEAYRLRMQADITKAVEDIVDALQVLDAPPSNADGDMPMDGPDDLQIDASGGEGGEAVEAAGGGDGKPPSAGGSCGEGGSSGEPIEAQMRDKLAAHTESIVSELMQMERDEADACSLEMQNLVTSATEMLAEMESAEAEIRLLRNLCDMLSQQQQKHREADSTPSEQ